MGGLCENGGIMPPCVGIIMPWLKGDAWCIGGRGMRPYWSGCLLDMTGALGGGMEFTLVHTEESDCTLEVEELWYPESAEGFSGMGGVASVGPRGRGGPMPCSPHWPMGSRGPLKFGSLGRGNLCPMLGPKC